MDTTFISSLNERFGNIIDSIHIALSGEEIDIKSLNKNFSNFRNIVFCLLSKSLLSGEYLKYDVRENIEKIINETYIETPPDGTDLVLAFFLKLSNYLTCFRKSLLKYLYFINSIKHQYDNSKEDLFFNFERNVNVGNEDSLLFYFHNYFIDIQDIGHRLIYKQEIIQRLFLAYLELKNFIRTSAEVKGEIEDIFKHVKGHVVLQILKLIEDRDSVIIVEREFQNINNIRSELENTIYFSSYENYQKLIGKIRIEKNDLSALEKKIKENTANFSDYILLTSQYQRRNEYQKMVKLYDVFCKKIQDVKSNTVYDKYCISSIHNYLFNCKHSLWLKLKKSNITLDEIETQLDFLSRFQEDTDISNFHPYYKTFKFLEDFIKQKLKAQNVDVALMNKAKDILKECFYKYKSNLNWCERQKYIPFLLPMDESLFHVSGKGINIFIPSSFARPVDYEKYKDEYLDLRAEVKAIELRIDLAINSVTIEELKSELQNNKKDNFKLLGGFSAVITFLFSCVNLFSSNASLPISEAMDRVIVIAFLIILLVTSIYLLLLRKKIISIIVWFVLFFGSVSFIIYNKMSRKQYNIEGEAPKNDSINVFNKDTNNDLLNKGN